MFYKQVYLHLLSVKQGFSPMQHSTHPFRRMGRKRDGWLQEAITKSRPVSSQTCTQCLGTNPGLNES